MDATRWTRERFGDAQARSSNTRWVLSVIFLAAACSRGGPYAGVGDVVGFDDARQHVTIRHDGIPGLTGPTTASYDVHSPQLLADLRPGARVRFTLQQEHGQLVVTRLGLVSMGMPGVHDHTPHHGGIVGMDGMIHLEALATPDGRVRVYLSDVWRQPLPLANVSGSVTLRLPAGKRTIPLQPAGEALEASGPPLEGPEVYAHVELTHEAQLAEMNFVLPLANGAPAAVGIPQNGCTPVTAPGSQRAPYCTLTFDHSITAIAAMPDGGTALVAAVDQGVSGWRLPKGELAVGFAPPPPLAVPITEAQHPEATTAITVNRTGTEAIVALEGRLLRYTIASGQLTQVLPGPGGVLRDVAWSPDGATLLVTAFYDGAAHLVSAADGSEIRRLPIQPEGAAVAFAADGRLVAVGTNLGRIFLYDPATGRQLGQLVGASGAVHALAFVDRQLVSAGDDGVLRVWDSGTRTLLHQAPANRMLTRIAVAPDGRRIASAGLDGVVRLYDVSTGTLLDTLEWHSAQVLGLAWTGSSLVSGDLAGRVALWKPPGAPAERPN